MRTLLLLLASLPVFGVTASPSSITVYMRALGPYPDIGSRPPVTTTITISGSGSWNMSRGGSLSTACPANFGYCFNAVTAVSGGCGGALPTGSGAGTVYLCWNGVITSEPAIGTHTGTLTIGDTVISITLNVMPANVYSAWAARSGYPSGCSTPANFDTEATCTITDERPTSTSFSIPSAGGSYTDPQHGHVVKRLTAVGQNIQYGAVTAFSATGKYVMTSDAAGNIDIYNRATAAETYSNVPTANINFSSWDPSDDERMWFMDGGTIKYRQLDTASVTTAADYTLASGSRPAMTSITMGGTVDITDDGWWAFREGTADTVCAVNLNGLTTSTQESQTYCANYASLSLTDIDFTQMSQVDSESRKRYVVLVSAPSGHVYSVGSSSLTYEYAIPTSNLGDVTAEPHSDIGQDEQGRQIFWWSWYDPYGSWVWLGSIMLSKGSDMTRPVEEGGGLRIHSNINPDDGTTDAHYGCTWRGVCVYTPYGNSGGITAKQIQSITAANPCQINSTSHGYSSSNSVQIGGALGTGVSAMNGIHTVTVTTANQYTIPVDCSSGWTYTADSAHSALSTAATNDPFRQETMISRLGQWTRRIAIHRTKTYNGGGLSSYYATPRASISRDGAYIAFASNFGVPEGSSVYIAETGITTAQTLATSVDPADTKAVLNYVMPATSGAATVTISASPSLTSPVVSASDGLATLARQYVASGLTADTQYYFRVASAEWSFTGRFRTLPALSGTGRLQIAKGGGGSIGYGTTTSLGSSCTSPCDIAPSKGVLYHNGSGSVAAVVVR